MTDAEERLRRGLEALGFDPTVIAAPLLAFTRLVIEANASTNLVGAKSVDDLVAPHLLDSLAPFAGSEVKGRIIDVGSGAGLPGIPLAIAFPSASILMLEPRAKRFEFLHAAIRSLSLTNATTEKRTAEAVGRSPARESADLVTVRALASPDIALELSAPLAKRGGRVLLYIGRQSTPTDDELKASAALGLDFQEAKTVEVPYLLGVRHAWWFVKKKRTTNAHPPSRAKKAVKTTL